MGVSALMLMTHSFLVECFLDRDQLPVFLALALSVSEMGWVKVFLAVCLRISQVFFCWHYTTS